MGYIQAISINTGTPYLIEPTVFAALTNTGDTATALSTTIPNFELASGISITIQMTVTNNANATLNINNSVAKPIYYKNAPIEANMMHKDYIYNLVYDGTKWHVVGEKLGEIKLSHKLTFGADQAYVYDGSADVTVPVYTGTTL